MRPLKIVAIVVGALLIIVGLGLTATGGFLLWAYDTQRDADGFFDTASREVATDSYALTSPKLAVDVGTRLGDWIPKGVTGTVRLRVQTTGKDVFLGIGPTDRVDQYLGGVAHDEMVGFAGRTGTIDYRRVQGGAPATLPVAQDFWVAQTSGSGTQDLRWEIAAGDWTAVIMNADGSPGIQARASVGARFPILLPIGIGLLVAGILGLVIGVVLVILGARPTHPVPTHPNGYPDPYGRYPAPGSRYYQGEPDYRRNSYPPVGDRPAEGAPGGQPSVPPADQPPGYAPPPPPPAPAPAGYPPNQPPASSSAAPSADRPTGAPER